MKSARGLEECAPSSQLCPYPRGLETPGVGFSAEFTAFALGQVLGGGCVTWEIL